jgi:hypothetical protein
VLQAILNRLGKVAKGAEDSMDDILETLTPSHQIPEATKANDPGEFC